MSQSVADTKEDTAVAALLGDIATAVESCSIIGWQYAGMLARYNLYGPRHSVEIATSGRMHKMSFCDRDLDIEKHLRDIKMIQFWMGGKQLCQMEIARLFYECDAL